MIIQLAFRRLHVVLGPLFRPRRPPIPPCWIDAIREYNRPHPETETDRLEYARRCRRVLQNRLASAEWQGPITYEKG